MLLYYQCYYFRQNSYRAGRQTGPIQKQTGKEFAAAVSLLPLILNSCGNFVAVTETVVSIYLLLLDYTPD